MDGLGKQRLVVGKFRDLHFLDPRWPSPKEILLSRLPVGDRLIMTPHRYLRRAWRNVERSLLTSSKGRRFPKAPPLACVSCLIRKRELRRSFCERDTDYDRRSTLTTTLNSPILVYVLLKGQLVIV